jgi:hypothetical protein
VVITSIVPGPAAKPVIGEATSIVMGVPERDSPLDAGAIVLDALKLYTLAPTFMFVVLESPVISELPAVSATFENVEVV